MFPQLAAAAALAAGLAPAPVTFDPGTNSGYVGAGAIREAFGWSPATLTARAAGVAFQHGFRGEDTYAVSCGGRPFRVVHPHDYGHYELNVTVKRASSGYRDVTGFRIRGAYAGISGTSPAPSPGDPCPQKHAGGSKVTRSARVASVTTWTLTAIWQDVHRQLLVRKSRA
ncbi:hypothetical protein ACFQS1_36990 [Paractinoplanes rhizophilus]|jgi:hypothetical protein|uniref:Uncharacterized protein n=1 Tax=Paractinoplanes rhizophilus TaxID=1416877 RepID=A0ABW2I447_9ACTN|nr:hypothetical protein [Actinoplanes sp.]